MENSLSRLGYHLIQDAIDPSMVKALRATFDELASGEGRACVRSAFHHSKKIRSLAISETILRHLPPNFRPVRCILFDKTPDSNWPVAWHQDLTIAVKEESPTSGYSNWSIKDSITHVQPPVELLEKMITLRIHLDLTSAENGALKVIPSSHTLNRISTDHIADLTQENVTICTCLAGEVLLMKPLILHASDRSISPVHRRVIHIEYADPSTLAKGLNWNDQL